jgi:hypothetical protein
LYLCYALQQKASLNSLLCPFQLYLCTLPYRNPCCPFFLSRNFVGLIAISCPPIDFFPYPFHKEATIYKNTINEIVKLEYIDILIQLVKYQTLASKSKIVGRGKVGGYRVPLHFIALMCWLHTLSPVTQ